AHLVNELAHSHLLRSAHLVETAAISSRVIDGLDGRDTQKKCGFVVGNLWSKSPDFLPESFLLPHRKAIVVLIEDRLQPIGIQSRSAPEVGRRWLKKRVRIQR